MRYATTLVGLPLVASAAAVAMVTATPALAGEVWWAGDSAHVGTGDSGWRAVSTTVRGEAQTWALGEEDGKTMVAAGSGTALTKLKVPSAVRDLDAFALDAVSPTDVWLIGEKSPDASAKTVLHYDGSTWTDVTPDGGAYGETVTASGSRGWALTGEQGAAYRAEGEWHRTRVTETGTVTNLTAWASDDVWAGGNDGGKPAIWHYDGTAWAKTRLPSLPGCGSATVDAPARDKAFAYCQVTEQVGEEEENVELAGLRWTGSAWAEAGRQENRNSTATDLTSAADGQAWVAGGEGRVWHYDGTRWSTDTVERPENGQSPGATVTAVAAPRDTGDVVAVGHLTWPVEGGGEHLTDQTWSGKR